MDTGQSILAFTSGLVVLMTAAYFLARRQAVATASTGVKMHSLPGQYGWYAVITAALPALGVAIAGAFLHLVGFPAPSGIIIVVAALAIAAGGLWYGLHTVRPSLRARAFIDNVVRRLLQAAALVSIFTTIGIVLSVLFESLRFFGEISFLDFITGTEWNPSAAFGGDTGMAPEFGAVPLFLGTAVISLIAMCVALPVGLFAAIYMAEYASAPVRAWAKPVLEVLAGIPTVVYGFFAALTVSPLVVVVAEFFGLDVEYTNALAPGLVMGIMITPYISSLSDDVLNAVPNKLREGAYALGTTRAETIKHIVLPAAFPGILAASLLGVSRALGETMIVVMAAGLRPNMTINPLEDLTTVTVQISDSLTGDLSFDSPATQSAFALGLVLFAVTLIFNLISNVMVRRFRQRYV
ncbi:MAG: phosphate ABC transporter permease subunit PstC [Gammaproteobacteria bacterium]